MEAKEKIIVALDTKDPYKTLELVNALAPFVGGFKLGLEFFTNLFVHMVMLMLDENSIAIFRATVRALFHALQDKLFWDGKWADIPDTMAGAALGIAPLKPRFINVHASSGIESIKAAVANKGTAKVLGVTILTSIEERECHTIFGASPCGIACFLSNILKRAGADGVICSPQEIESVRKEISDNVNMLIVTPDIWPKWAPAQDQKRIMTPAEAIKAGADYLVIGHPITKPPAEIGTPVDAAKKIAEEIAAVL